MKNVCVELYSERDSIISLGKIMTTKTCEKDQLFGFEKEKIDMISGNW